MPTQPLPDDVSILRQRIAELENRLAEQERIFLDSETRYRSLFDAAFEGIVIHENGIILDLNPSYAQIFGYEPYEMIGMSIYEVVAEEYHEIVRAKVSQAVPDLYEIIGKRKDGSRIYLEIIGKSYLYQGRPVRVAGVRDTTARREAHAQRLEQQRLAEALRDTAALLNSTLDPESVMNRILENVGRVVPHDAANIMLIDGGIARVRYWRGYSPEDELILKSFALRIDETPNLQRMFTQGSPLAIPNTHTYPGWVERKNTLKVWSYAGAPIKIDGETIIGFINLDSNTPYALTDVHAQYLQAFADQAAIAIKNARLHAALQDSEMRNRAILDAIPDAMFRIDADGTYTDAHLPPSDPTPPEAIIGKTLADFMPPQVAETGLAYIRKTLASGHMHLYEYQLPGLDGSLRDFEARLMVCGENSVLVIVRDITRRKQAQRDLARARDEALEASRIKSQFLANMSHELRTPLNSIINYTQLMMDGVYGEVNRTQIDRLEKVNRNGQTLLALVNDVLDLSKIEAGHLVLKRRRVNTLDFIHTILGVFFPMAEEKGLYLQYLGDDTPDLYVDEARARQILTNIIGNAIKFTHQGGVSITTEAQAGMLRFAITDTGIGIPQEAQSQIFDEFRQVDSGYTRQYEGTGLGLTISKRLAEMHGGSIEVISELGKGSTFYVSFPVASSIDVQEE
jgi:PAS domain S-box-containing protein